MCEILRASLEPMALQFTVIRDEYLLLPNAQVIRVDHELPVDNSYVSPIVRFVPFNRSPRVEIPNLANLVALGPDDLDEHLVLAERMDDGNDRVVPVVVMNDTITPFSSPEDKCHQAASVLKMWEHRRPNEIGDFVEALPGHTVACAHIMALGAPLSDGTNGRLRHMAMCDGDELARAFSVLN
jgi:hypothetical protein